jgi:hypothetical protein
MALEILCQRSDLTRRRFDPVAREILCSIPRSKRRPSFRPKNSPQSRFESCRRATARDQEARRFNCLPADTRRDARPAIQRVGLPRPRSPGTPTIKADRSGSASSGPTRGQAEGQHPCSRRQEAEIGWRKGPSQLSMHDAVLAVVAKLIDALDHAFPASRDLELRTHRKLRMGHEQSKPIPFTLGRWCDDVDFLRQRLRAFHSAT